MRSRWIGGVILLFAGVEPEASGQEGRQTPPVADLAGLVKQARADFKQASKEFGDKIRGITDSVEQTRMMFEESPRAEDCLQRFLPALEAAPKDPAALPALVWAAQQQVAADSQRRVLSLLIQHHVDSDQIVQITDRLFPTLEAVRFLQGVIDESTVRVNRGAASYGLAEVLGLQVDLVRIGPAMNDMMDPSLHEAYMRELGVMMGETLPWVLKADPEALDARRRQLLQSVIDDYGDVTAGFVVLGEAARADLEELATLNIGMAAPEIVGTDIDGVRFKLSDYKGKVVVLDFWGDW